MRTVVVAAILTLAAGSALAADPETSAVTIIRQPDQVEVNIRNVTHALTGEIVSPRARRERLLLRLEARTTEVLGEKGIEGEVRLAALPLEAGSGAKPIFEAVEKGRNIAIDEDDLIAIDLDDCCHFERVYYSPWTGEALFQASAPPAWINIGREFRTRRVAAFRAATDDLVDAGTLPKTAVGIVTYAAVDRVIRQIVVEAPDEERARVLRSISDEHFVLSWIDGASGLPLPAEVAVPGAQPTLRLLFVRAQVDVRIPLAGDDLRTDQIRDGVGLAFKPLPQVPLAGSWRVVAAATAPWAKGAMLAPLKDGHVVFGTTAVRSGTVLDCAKPQYEARAVPPEGLFQGAFAPESAAKQAAALGLASTAIPSVLLTCDAGLFDFHGDKDGRMLFALDNVIYTLERALP